MYVMTNMREYQKGVCSRLRGTATLKLWEAKVVWIWGTDNRLTMMIMTMTMKSVKWVLCCAVASGTLMYLVLCCRNSYPSCTVILYVRMMLSGNLQQFKDFSWNFIFKSIINSASCW